MTDVASASQALQGMAMSGLIKPQLLSTTPKPHASDLLPSGVTRDTHDRDTSLSKLNLQVLDAWIPKLELEHGVKTLRWVLARAIEDEAVFNHFFFHAFYSSVNSSAINESGSSSDRLSIFFYFYFFLFVLLFIFSRKFASRSF